MELTRELLEQRRAELVADYNAIGGALQQVDWTLAKLDEVNDGEQGSRPAPLPANIDGPPAIPETGARMGVVEDT